MSESTIWSQLRAAGFTEAGTAGIMGNLKAESLLKSDIVETRSGISGSDYTAQVDSGMRSRSTFIYDSFGYGLAQWTYYSRKAGLYDYCKSKGVSIGNEAAQVEYLLREMSQSYTSLLNYLKSTTDTYTATSRMCTEFEKPAYNNISARYQYAQQILANNKGASVAASSSGDLAQYSDLVSARMPLLAQGSKGVAVGMAQYAMSKHSIAVTIDCDFGPGTLTAVNAFKSAHGIPNTGNDYGKVTAAMWEALYA